jgi:DUF1365 family protein
MNSAIYTGQLRHRRFAPRTHEFSYQLFMMYVDLAELDEVFRGRWLWSVKRPALAWLRRADYLADESDARVPLDHAVRNRVQQETGSRPRGPIRMLTQLRYFGVGFNPVTFYYCFDSEDTQVETIVAEITNTPWQERHAYVLTTHTSPGWSRSISPPAIAGEDMEARHDRLRFLFRKSFHVSPFMSMDFDYDWRFSTPSERLTVHMQNLQGDAKLFDATLDVKRHEITGTSLARILTFFPCMTATVVVGIYWQALKLWLKRIPFHSHTYSKDLKHERPHSTL